MCGRARCTLQPKEIPRACGINDDSVRNLHMERYNPCYNVSPGSHLPVVRKEEGSGQGAVLHCMKWGLIPSFTKKTEKPDHFRMFNARSESICEKASFRRLVPNKRCLVAVEGFYEWKKDGSKKQPYYIHFKDHRPLVFAALYDSWGNSEGEILYTFTIVTTTCSSALQWLHDRMPVILGNNDSINAWLNGSPSSKFNTILQPYEGLDLAWYPVTPAMGKQSFNGPECIKEIQLKPEGKNSISKFFSSRTANNKRKLEPLVKNSTEESTRTDQFVSVKEEPVSEEHKENKELLIGSEQDNFDAKTEVSSPPNKGAEICGIKRDHESFSTDMKPSTDNIDKGFTVSAKKKSHVKNSGDKQPTLLSYFGRS